jgi:hypothetical protein
VNPTGISNPTIDLQGSDLFFANPQNNGIGFTVGKNSVLQNFTVDYLHLPFIQLQITTVNAAQRQLQFTIVPGWWPRQDIHAFKQ